MYKKTIKRGERNFDYYIYVDYSENLIGYIIIERNKIEELIPKISRFRHYRQSKNRKIYLKHINDTIKKEKIYSSLLEFKIKERLFTPNKDSIINRIFNSLDLTNFLV